jgi:malate dehydrogenase (oxaloacetate-decarboxylating)(NADP+)
VLATGRSDYPNQVNNVLCFPFIFRGALDVGATTITRAMEIAAVHALAALARQEQSDIVAAAYGGVEDLSFGPGYLIPKPFDPRLIVKIAPAVAQAAMESGVATRPIADLDAYARQLEQFVYHSGTLMAPIFAAARKIHPNTAASSTPRARTSACCGRCRSWSTSGWEAHSHRAPGGDRARHRTPRLAASRRRAGHGGQSGAGPRYREYWQEYHRLTRAAASPRNTPSWKCAAAPRSSAPCCCARARRTD